MFRQLVSRNAAVLVNLGDDRATAKTIGNLKTNRAEDPRKRLTICITGYGYPSLRRDKLSEETPRQLYAAVSTAQTSGRNKITSAFGQ